MTEYWWKVVVDNNAELVEWDSVSQMLIAPTVVSFLAQKLVNDEVVVAMTPVGPKMVANLDKPWAAWATISEAIIRSGYELIDGSPAPLEPEMELRGFSEESD